MATLIPKPETHEKDPNARKDYGFDWAPFLAGDTVQSATWFIDSPPDASLALEGPRVAGTQTFIWIRGGTLGEKYRVTCRMASAGGRIEDRSFFVKIKQA